MGVEVVSSSQRGVQVLVCVAKNHQKVGILDGKWAIFHQCPSCLPPLPDPKLQDPHQLFHKMCTANLLPLVLPCNVCGTLFFKNASPPLNLESFHWSKFHLDLWVF